MSSEENFFNIVFYLVDYLFVVPCASHICYKVSHVSTINKIVCFIIMPFFYFFMLRGWCMMISSRRRVLSICV